MKRFLSALVLLVIFATTNITTVNAASSANVPYGYTYDDSATYKTVYRFYDFSSSRNTYFLAREFYSKGSYVYTSSGVLVSNQSAGAGSKFQGYDESGNFFIVGVNGSLSKLDTTNKVTVLLESGVIKLNYNEDELAYSITTISGTVYLSNFKPAPEVDNDDDYNEPVVSKPSNRVEIYTNSAKELVYDAYASNKLKSRIVVSANGSKVLNATAKVRLTDTLKGAKFVGFDSSYNVYLYEGSSLYRFKNGSWFSAQKMQLSGTYKSFKKDDAGFISQVVTSKNTYTIKQLTVSGKWKAKRTYAVHKSNYITMYVKGKTTSYTLSTSKGVLKLNGKKVASGVSKYGFIGAKKLIYVKNGKIYTATIKNLKKQKICNGKTLKTNSVGLVTKVITSAGKSKKVS